jgi:hypothetical protein
VADRVFAEQHADLVAGQHAVAAAFLEHRGPQPVGVGIVGQDQLGPGLRARASARSIAPFSSGFGKATVRKAPSASAWLGTTATTREAGPQEGAGRDPMADPVHGGVDDPQGGGARRVKGGLGQAIAIVGFDRIGNVVAQAGGGGIGGKTRFIAGTLGAAAMVAAISASSGGMICAPSAR